MPLAACFLSGKELRAKGLNRIGNMLVPNSNYCLFEDWIMPLLDDMLEQQRTQGVVWTPSKVHSGDWLIYGYQMVVGCWVDQSGGNLPTSHWPTLGCCFWLPGKQ